MLDLFWDLHQQGQISAASDVASAAADKASRADAAARRTEQMLQRYMLITEAMWSLLREREGWNDEVLAARMTQLDLRDGKIDGTARRPTVPCPTCGRPFGANRTACMYCGARANNPFGGAAEGVGPATPPPAPPRGGPPGLAR